MSSKMAAIPLAAAFLLGGCLDFGPGSASGPALNTSALDISCLHQSAQTIQAYLDLRISDATQVQQFWGCLSHAAELFSNRVRGETPGVYTAEEVRYFVQSEFLPGERISDTLLAEVFELKRFLLGGDGGSITTAEIARARELIETLSAQSLSLYPDLPEITARHHARGLEAADDTLKSTSNAILPWLTRPDSAYSLSHLESFVSELETFVSDPGLQASLHALRARIPLARLLKKMVTGSGTDVIGAQEWRILLDLGRRSLLLGLRLHQLGSSGLDVFLGDGRRELSDLVSSSISLAQELIARQPAGRMPFEQLDGIIDALRPDDLPVQQKTLKDFMRPLFQRYLGGRIPGECGLAATSICPVGLGRLWDAFHHWSMGQDFAETLFARLGNSADGYPAAELLQPTLQDLYGKTAEDLDPALVDAAAVMRKLIATERPLYQHDDLRIGFLTAPSDRHTLYNQTQTYWQHEVVRLMMRGYSSHPTGDVDRDVATYDDFTQLYLGVRGLGREFKIMDADSDGVVAERFMEANLFMDTSDGDDTMNVGEATGLIAFLVSSKQFSSEIYDETSSHCPLGEIDSYGKRRIDFDCYRQRFFLNVDRWWSRMPELLAEYRGLSPSEQDDFERTFLMAAVGPKEYGHPLSSGDTDSVAMIPHYLESVFTRFDVNRTGFFNLADAETAFPIFERKIADVSHIHSHFQNLSLFTYLLAYGKPPAQNAGGIVSLVGWEAMRPLWSKYVKADRRKLLHVFAALGQQN